MKRFALVSVVLVVFAMSGVLEATVIFSEGFNDATMPATWTISNAPASVTPLSTVSSGSSPTASPYEGARFVRFNSYNMSAGTNSHLISPAISTVEKTNVVVSFAQFRDTGYATTWDRMYLRWSSDATNWTEAGVYPRTNTVNGWQLKTCPLTNLTDNLPALYLDFFFVSAYGNNCYLDAVQVSAEGAGDVNPASNLVATAVSKSQIDLTWSPNANGDTVMVASNGVATFGTPTNGTAYAVGGALPGGGGIIYKGSALTYVHNGLSAATRYYYAAWSVNVATQYSIKITADAVTDFTLIITQGFNSVTMPDGWAQVTLSNNYPVTFVTTNTHLYAGPYEGTHFVLFNSYNAGRGSKTQLLSPYFCPSSTVHQLAVQFAWYHDTSYNTETNEGVTVQWTTNNIDWYNIGTFYRYAAGKTGWFLKTVLVPTAIATAGRARIGFEFLSEFGNDCLLDAARIAAFDANGVLTVDTLFYERVNSTNYYWNLMAVNHSDALPADIPPRADALQVVLSNFYSNTEPGVTNTPDGWSVASEFLGPLPLDSSISNHWLLTLQCTNPAAALRAGATAEFTLATYTIPAYAGVETGRVDATTYLDVIGWLPVVPGWMGPIKGVPEPLAVVLLAGLLASMRLRRGA